MARLNTKSDLVYYIKSQLGYPTINIEVTDDQIGYIIDDAVQKFTEYAYGTLEEAVVFEIDGKGTYALPDTITNIIKLAKGSTSNITNFDNNFGEGYVPDLWSQQFFTGSLTDSIMPGIIAISNTTSILDKFFGDDIVYNFNYNKKQLHILEDWTGKCVLHYQYEYIADDSNDYIFNHEWIKNYTKAKTKELWSTVTGKFDQALVGGARINYDKMAQEAERDIDKLDEELRNKWSDPCPIFVG